MPSTPLRSPAGRFRSGPRGPRFGNPPAAVVARGNLPKPGRRKAFLRPSVPVPGGSDRPTRYGLRAISSRVWLRGLSAINKRTKAAREIVKWRAELMQDLGGEPTLTAAQRTRVETLVRTKLLLEHVDAQLLEYGTLFAKKGHLRATVKGILSERNRMADSVERGLVALGHHGKADGPALPPIADLLVGSQIPSDGPQSSGRRSDRRNGR